VGGVPRSLLVAGEHVLDVALVEERVIDVQYGAPGVPENVFHALVPERAHEDLRAAQDLTALCHDFCPHWCESANRAKLMVTKEQVKMGRKPGHRAGGRPKGGRRIVRGPALR